MAVLRRLIRTLGYADLLLIITKQFILYSGLRTADGVANAKDGKNIDAVLIPKH